MGSEELESGLGSERLGLGELELEEGWGQRNCGWSRRGGVGVRGVVVRGVTVGGVGVGGRWSWGVGVRGWSRVNWGWALRLEGLVSGKVGIQVRGVRVGGEESWSWGWLPESECLLLMAKSAMQQKQKHKRMHKCPENNRKKSFNSMFVACTGFK